MKNLLDLKFGSTRTDHHSVCRQGIFIMKPALSITWTSIACLFAAFGSEPTCSGQACSGQACSGQAWAQQASPGAHSVPAHQSSAAPSGGPADAKVEFQNDSVVVVRVRMAPHEKTPMHDIASARLVVWLTDAHLRDTHPDGTTNETHRRAGEFDWVPVQRHAGENLSHEPIEFLAISPKTSAAAAAK
jgi:hypothetical protein